jgi:ribosome-interacting GTPase 1
MPTNLPPEYYEAEERYKTAQTTDEKVAALEELLSTIPKHKGTDKLRADFRKRLSKLKAAAQSHKGVSKQTSVFHIDREGAGQVAVVGCANVGKSALVATVTNATPEVAAYPFTTWVPTPGMMPVENIQIQLIDTPPLNPDYVEGELLNLIRRADMILLLVDLQSYPLQQLEDAMTLLEEHRILPERWRARYADPRRLIFKPFLVVANKCDDEGLDEDFEVLCELVGNDWTLVSASIKTGRGLEDLKETIFQRLEIMRIYAKPPGAQPDFSAPFVLRRGGTVGEFAAKVHKDFLENLKSARVWGEGVFDGQMVGREHILHDGDVVELRI